MGREGTHTSGMADCAPSAFVYLVTGGFAIVVERMKIVKQSNGMGIS
jgi:hypothetical protein